MSNEVNREVARQFFEQIWNQRDESAIDRFTIPDVRGNDGDFGTGREAFKEQWRGWFIGFPDLKFEVADIVVEGEKVVTRWVLTGTNTGPFLGHAPTGRAVRVDGMSLDRIVDGKVVEGFDAWDALGLRRQLGFIPPDDAP